MFLLHYLFHIEEWCIGSCIYCNEETGSVLLITEFEHLFYVQDIIVLILVLFILKSVVDFIWIHECRHVRILVGTCLFFFILALRNYGIYDFWSKKFALYQITLAWLGEKDKPLMQSHGQKRQGNDWKHTIQFSEYRSTCYKCWDHSSQSKDVIFTIKKYEKNCEFCYILTAHVE